VIAYKNVLLIPVMRGFINIFMIYSNKEKPTISPKPASSVN
jgi:hypothetical protein